MITKFGKRFLTSYLSGNNSFSSKEIALRMQKENIGAIVIIKDCKPLGIITNKYLRNKIVRGEFPLGTKSELIMTTPAATASIHIPFQKHIFRC